MAVLPGHRLVDAGASYGQAGCGRTNCLAYGPVRMRGDARLHGGHARCECGEVSPHLDSNRERRDWHRGHKIEVGRRSPESGGTAPVEVSLW